MNNSKDRKTSVVVLLFLALALLYSTDLNQPQDITFSPTINKITVDNKTVSDQKNTQTNKITSNAILNKKASTIALFKNKNKVLFHNTKLKDIDKVYFKDIKKDSIEKHIKGTIQDFIWIENAPSGGQVELPSTYGAIYRCTGEPREPACEQLKECNNIAQDTNCYYEKNQKSRVIIDHFSGIFGVDINILNIQSYPTVGGNWTVKFETKGTANLIITAEDNTSFSKVETNASIDDLQFLDLKRGNEKLTDFYYIVEKGDENE